MDTPKKQQPCDPDLLHPGVQADLHKYLETAVCGSKETRTFSAALLSDLFGFECCGIPRDRSARLRDRKWFRV